MLPLQAYVIRGSRLQANLTNPITDRHFILYAVNELSAYKKAGEVALPGEKMAVVGRCYF